MYGLKLEQSVTETQIWQNNKSCVFILKLLVNYREEKVWYEWHIHENWLNKKNIYLYWNFYCLI